MGDDFYSCGVAKALYTSSNCYYTVNYPWPDKRSSVPRSAKTSPYTAFITTRDFHNYVSKWPNCNDNSAVICCSTHCKNW